jgi:mono/diheme cytochrome c family protein
MQHEGHCAFLAGVQLHLGDEIGRRFMTNKIPRNSIKLGVLIAVVCAGWLLKCSQARAQTLVQNSKPEEVRLIDSIQGPALYQAYCSSCHGKDAKGSGPMAPSLKVAPSDLTRITARNGGKFPLMHIQKIISGEEHTAPAHGSREMPVWGPIFSEVARDQDLGRVRIDNLARYIRDIQTK